MKRLLLILCCILAVTSVNSCSNDELTPDNDKDINETPVNPDAPDENPDEPEDPQQPEFQIIRPIFDAQFNDDGTMTDISDSRYHVNTFDGLYMTTWKHPSYGGNLVRFSHSYGETFSDSYHKFNYSMEKDFKNRLSDGYSLEAICMFDDENDGSLEIKAFSSMESGGTGIMISNNSKGKVLTFLTNVSTTGKSNWVWGTSGIVPERGRYYHIIGVWDKEKGEAKVYVDGELKNTVKTYGEFVFPSTPACHWFCIGGDPGATSAQAAWKGDIAMARIYDEPLTEEYIKNYYPTLGINIPKSDFLPENVMYLTTCNIAKGGSFVISGWGFQSSDILIIESDNGSYRAECSCQANEINITATLPEDITDGRYKLIMKRNQDLYPLGKVKFTISESAIELKEAKVIAHRGYHKDGIPENSIEGFKKAQELCVYGSELDVWITLDGVIVCNHDGVMSGKTIQNCNYDEVKDLKLGNGEKLPLFTDVLTELKKSKVTKLILEFKTHNTREKNNLVIDTALKMIDDAGLNDMVEYIAFDYENCKRIAAARPEAMVGYLNGDRKPADLLADGIRSIDYSSGTLASHPEWIKEAQDLGMIVNVWTVNSDNELMKWLGEGVDYITTDNPDNLQAIIKAFCK